MKFIHTADWHIGALRVKMPEDYLSRSESMIKNIQVMVENKSDGILVIAGDIFHTKFVTEHERLLLLEYLSTFDTLGITTIICNGNHDLIYPKFSTLRWLSVLCDKGKLKNVKVADCKIRKFKVNEFTFFMVPPRFKKDDPRMNASKISKQIKDPNTIVVSHFATQGVKTDNGYNLPKGSRRKFHNALYWALGDIHLSQKVGKTAWYCGSPVQHNWGEKPGKGVLVVDTNRPSRPKFVEIPSKHLITVKGDSKDWPENCHIRVEGDMANKNLPDNVVDFQPVIEQQSNDDTKDVPFINRLQSHLNTLGVDRKDQKRYLKTIKSILQS